MVVVNVDLRAPDPEAPGGLRTPDGVLRFYPTRRHTVGDFVVLPARADVRVVDGVALIELEATPLDGAWLWCVSERLQGGSVFCFELPDVAEVEYADLIPVDPDEPSGFQHVDPSGWSLLSGDTVQAAFDSADAVLVDHAGDITDLDASVVGLGATTAAQAGQISALQSTDSTHNAQIFELQSAAVNSRSTGVGSGGVASGVGTGAIAYTAGSGNIAYPVTGTYVGVSWAAGSLNVSAQADGRYFAYFDAAGILTTTTTEPTSLDYRERIYLFRYTVQSGVVTFLTQAQMPLRNPLGSLQDLWRAIGPVKTGMAASAAAANLTVAVASGVLYQPGANTGTSYADPNALTVAATSPTVMLHMTRTGAVTPGSTNLDVAHYDVGGVVTAVPGSTSRAVIHQLHRFSSGATVVLYSQAWWNDLAAAIAALPTYRPVRPTALRDAVSLGYVVTTAGATNLADTVTSQFVNSNRFGLVAP